MSKISILEETAITLNADLIKHYCEEHSIKHLYAYAMAVYTTRALGYMKKDKFLAEYSKNLNISVKSSYRWIKFLKNEGVITELNGILRVKSKSRYLDQLNITSKMNFKAITDDILSFANFRLFCIRSTGIRLQNSFKRNHKKLLNRNKEIILKSIESPLKMEGIPLVMASNKSKVGCSLSYLSKRLGLSKSTCSKVLKGHTNPNYQFISYMSYSVFRNLFINTVGNKYMYQIHRDKYNRTILVQRLSNSIVGEYRAARRGPKTKNSILMVEKMRK